MRPTGIPQKGTNHPAIILIGISTMEMMDKKMDDDEGLIKSQSNKTKCIEKIKIKKMQKTVQRMSEREKEQPSQDMPGIHLGPFSRQTVLATGGEE